MAAIALRNPLHFWISIPLLLFTLSAGLAVFPAFDRAAALHFAVRIPSLAIVYFFLSRGFASGRLTMPTVAAWLAPGVALNGCVAILQTIHQNPIGLTWLAEPRMLRTTPGTAVILVHGVRVLRAFGVMPHANVLGGLLSGALPLIACPLLCAGMETGRAGRAHRRLHGRDSGWRADTSSITRLLRSSAFAACCLCPRQRASSAQLLSLFLGGLVGGHTLLRMVGDRQAAKNHPPRLDDRGGNPSLIVSSLIGTRTRRGTGPPAPGEQSP